MSKYIDAEQLKAEIERRIGICKRVAGDERNEEDMRRYYQGKVVALEEIQHLAPSLQQEQPSLPSDLDEAAEEALKKAYPADAYYYVGRTGRRLFKEGFKAGAEWMAGQGETFNGYISVKGKRSLIAIEGKSDIYKYGDKVVVQIRKK